VNGGTERPIWRGVVESDNLIDLETAIADRVMTALSGSPPARTRARTENGTAYQAYLQGRFYLSRYTAEDTRRAVAAFDAALATDAKYPLAHAGLAKASAQMFIRFASDGESGPWRNRAEQHARRALELDGTLAEAHEALAAVARHIDFDWDRTIEQSVEALRLNPSLDLPHYYLASALQHTGRLDMVESQVMAGLEANPLNLAEAYRLRGTNALWGGHFAEARIHFERLRELAGKPVSYTPLAQALYYLGEWTQAEAMLRGLRGSAQSEQRARAMLSSFLAARGERRAALALVGEVLSHPYRDHHVAYSLGAAYAGLERPGDAFRWLREAAASGFLCRSWYATDPLLEPLRTMREFPALLSQVETAGHRIDVSAVRDLDRVP
jgi:tetratricopeptide (TPR) repeat protein